MGGALAREGSWWCTAWRWAEGGGHPGAVSQQSTHVQKLSGTSSPGKFRNSSVCERLWKYKNQGPRGNGNQIPATPEVPPAAVKAFKTRDIKMFYLLLFFNMGNCDRVFTQLCAEPLGSSPSSNCFWNFERRNDLACPDLNKTHSEQVLRRQAGSQGGLCC